ncbi:glycoside hydrolase family 16 protein [Actinoplanes oblitus]|uniref:Glycoside hydrolase family 16 protein n=1 Tax=Actinoplanes oblitus TaxID=3040509 RepID=A0ABY8W4W2_9ACTN|nr:glycoside hydrolase family 16 protein [Actinoplanes oblitus]WIM92889.1 glycoside hydrolase family 16 protein [Actinoplanes oblitus]
MIRRMLVLLTCVVLSGCGAATPAETIRPLGAPGGWRLIFGDDFDGTALDPARWADRSSAEPDDGRGNPGNEQLEWNQAANCRVGDGRLTMTARREPVTSPLSGQRYAWTSCLITSSPAAHFRYGFVEERAILPAHRGFWPAFWTWQAPGVDRHAETDVYEYYSDNPLRLYGTQFSGAGGRCEWRPPFHPAGGWHTYGAAIEPDGTTWYVDGTAICHTTATSDAPTALISNLAVYSRIPPEPGTGAAVKQVDYIRAWATAPSRQG